MVWDKFASSVSRDDSVSHGGDDDDDDDDDGDVRQSEEVTRIAVARKLGCLARKPQSCLCVWQDSRHTRFAWFGLLQKCSLATATQPSE